MYGARQGDGLSLSPGEVGGGGDDGGNWGGGRGGGGKGEEGEGQTHWSGAQLAHLGSLYPDVYRPTQVLIILSVSDVE